jgi:hypothetical protein
LHSLIISVKFVVIELMSSFSRFWYDFNKASLVGGTVDFDISKNLNFTTFFNFYNAKNGSFVSFELGYEGNRKNA